MNTLSSLKTSNTESEASFLSSLVGGHIHQLRSVERGRRFVMDGTAFRLVQHDRNTVYTLQRNRKWFLKIVPRAQQRPLRCENLGVLAATCCLNKLEGYHGPTTFIDMDRGYVLSEAVPGRQFNVALYQGCLRGWVYTTKLRSLFFNLGVSIATLHRHTALNGVEPSNRDPCSALSRLLRSCNLDGAMVRPIAQWFDAHTAPIQNRVFVHGNFKFENSLAVGTKVTILDWENCGAGSPEVDLSFIALHFVLLRMAPVVGKLKGSTAFLSFLDGYKSVAHFDENKLLWYTTCRICSCYLDHCHVKLSRPRVAGIPLRKDRVESRVANLIDQYDDLASNGKGLFENGIV